MERNRFRLKDVILAWNCMRCWTERRGHNSICFSIGICTVSLTSECWICRFRIYPLRLAVYTCVYGFGLYKWWAFVSSWIEFLESQSITASIARARASGVRPSESYQNPVRPTNFDGACTPDPGDNVSRNSGPQKIGGGLVSEAFSPDFSLWWWMIPARSFPLQYSSTVWHVQLMIIFLRNVAFIVGISGNWVMNFWCTPLMNDRRSYL